MPVKSLPIEQILSMLAEALPRLRTLTEGLKSSPLHTPPQPGEWSANEVLAHLRSCADVWGRSIEVILVEDQPIIRAINPRTWMKSTDYPEQDFQPSLQAFSKQRTGLLRVLKSLPEEAWWRTATVTGAGKPLERSVHSYAEGLALHERPHLKQIERIVMTVRQS